MKTLSQQLLKTASRSRRFLDRKSRREIAAFIQSKKNPAGGYCGRDNQPDLYYTFFAVASLRALGRPLPFSNLWRFARSFGTGDGLDLPHLVCLISLRSLFPFMGAGSACLEKHPTETAYAAFLKSLATPEESVLCFNVSGVTPNMAAAAVLNGVPDETAIEKLMSRHCEGGGFRTNPQAPLPDLLSTGVALFALQMMGADLDTVREPCLEFIEAQWRDSGGFTGHESDLFEDTEYVFYALLSIGSLMQ
jgi:prenyltransferase beta subunit